MEAALRRHSAALGLAHGGVAGKDVGQAPLTQRWEIESVFDELKTHLRQSRRVLRSKTPELVRQEFYGWVLAHYAVRWLLHQGAARHRLPHAELSFKGHLELLRRAQPRSGAFPPRAARTRAPLVP